MVKNLPANAGDARDPDSIPGLGRSRGGGHGNPLQYSCLENPMQRGDWWATVPGVTKSQTWLRYWAHTSALLEGQEDKGSMILMRWRKLLWPIYGRPNERCWRPKGCIKPLSICSTPSPAHPSPQISPKPRTLNIHPHLTHNFTLPLTSQAAMDCKASHKVFPPVHPGTFSFTL